ncbi:hypothetical protein CERZMDRAFT_85917 [Cercospora zeae-maydis SCOH1-5]|uniref:Uncharacterized protein n=1 Tax=Cercospora zeae-maydis SCOH1-5 TaxID=717836 RepID=A0A6A6FB27_9PEZI|nr:hypothetical protein CERZMDRAFT_85917 [Cercospora zeae-maydis SCOH1-5]
MYDSGKSSGHASEDRKNSGFEKITPRQIANVTGSTSKLMAFCSWLATLRALGQIAREPLASPRFLNYLQSFCSTAGAVSEETQANDYMRHEKSSGATTHMQLMTSCSHIIAPPSQQLYRTSAATKFQTRSKRPLEPVSLQSHTRVISN